MSKLIVAVLISPCISAADVNSTSNTTEIMACPHTVKIEERTLIDQFDYAKYQNNFFRLRKVMFAGEPKLVVR